MDQNEDFLSDLTLGHACRRQPDVVRKRPTISLLPDVSNSFQHLKECAGVSWLVVPVA
jgi:hypothetical protein